MKIFTSSCTKHYEIFLFDQVIHKECFDKVQACLTEEKAARDSFKSIRQRLDSVQSVIGKVKNAQSVGDIQEKV